MTVASIRGVVACLAGLAAAALSHACRAGEPKSPRIEITNVPPADKGGPDLLDSIAGRVVGAKPGQRVVIFSRSRIWWVQPEVRQPYTEIQTDSTWKNSTHLGTEYAALLVESSYRPPEYTEALPKEGDGIVAFTVVEGDRSRQAVRPTLQFSGHEWVVRAAPSDRGGRNDYDPTNAWIDEKGAMHLRIAGEGAHWTCAEVTLARHLGYGLYRFVVRETSHLEPAAVLSFFTWDGPAADANHREMDIQLSRWGDADGQNARFAIQPYRTPGNMVQFAAPAGVLTFWLRWEPGRATFRTVRGASADPAARAVAEHVFASGVPSPGNEQVRMNLYAYRRGHKPLERRAEVVVEHFEFTP